MRSCWRKCGAKTIPRWWSAPSSLRSPAVTFMRWFEIFLLDVSLLNYSVGCGTENLWNFAKEFCKNKYAKQNLLDAKTILIFQYFTYHLLFTAYLFIWCEVITVTFFWFSSPCWAGYSQGLQDCPQQLQSTVRGVEPARLTRSAGIAVGWLARTG